MKLPHPSDPHGDAEGSLPRSMVLDTLYRNGVSVQRDSDDDSTCRLEKGDILEIHDLPPIVGGVEIRQIARNFDIELVDFYYGHLQDRD